MNHVVGWGHQLPARFPRRARLRSTADFERVRSLGQTWRHPLFVLAVCRNELALCRVGVVVGKRIGKAVVRNRARRLLREAARLLYGQIAPGWDIVLVARPAIRAAQAQHVYAALGELTWQAGLIRAESKQVECVRWRSG